MLVAALALGSAWMLTGCALDRGALVPGENGMPQDAAGLDGAMESIDAGIVPVDAPREPVDARRADAALVPDGGCDWEGARCLGDALLDCSAGVLSERDCFANGEYCEDGDCVTWECTPNEVSCDGAQERRCDARGTASTTSDCARGCGATGCTPPTPCALDVHASIGVGSMRVNTCGQGDDATFSPSCTDRTVTGPDLLVRLEIARRDRYRIELRAIGSADPILYVRRACADASSQFLCNDDQSGLGRGSRVEMMLEPGDYFLVLDSYRAGGEPVDGRCGEMDLEVTTR